MSVQVQIRVYFDDDQIATLYSTQVPLIGEDLNLDEGDFVVDSRCWIGVEKTLVAEIHLKEATND